MQEGRPMPIFFYKLLAFSVIFITTPLVADVNILIIGSTKDSSEHRSIKGDSKAFSPELIKDELQKILEGVELGKVNITLLDRYQTQPGKYAYNLISWFHWPYPADVETNERWPNLQGKKSTKWDYVVLIGDPYTIEKMPGLYTHGVAKVAEQVAKGSAETILLMNWPAKSSKSTIDHYREVIYRTGRSGGFKVAPAAMAWEAAGKPSGESHPNKSGAYIAAASIYSRIWNKSAKASTYSYSSKLADTVDKIVKLNVGKPQYKGKFNFQSPFKMFNNQSRIVAPIKSGGGSSTEVDFIGRTGDAVKRAGALTGKGARYTIGRYTGRNPKGGKDFRNRGGNAFGYLYHVEGNNIDKTISNITGWEMFLANNMITELSDFRLIPRRILLGSLLQFDPKMKIVGGGHVYGSQATSVGTYIYTIISGRCPMDPKPNEITAQWHAQKTGYEMAWQVANCQTRAPGFKIMPSTNTKHTLDYKITEDMKVQFLFKPKSAVSVTINSDKPSLVVISSQSLTFTPDNYNIPQTLSLKAASSAKAGSEINIKFNTVSEDEVYNELNDSWRYNINTQPLANQIKVKATSGKITAITLKGSDQDEEILTYSVDKAPVNGSLTVSPGGVAAYTANKGFTGIDTFTFKTHDGSVYSEPASVTITVAKASLYDSNLLQNASGELSPFTKYSWVEAQGKWQQKTNAAQGIYALGVAEGNNAELIQNVDISVFSEAIKAGKQSFKISGFVDKSNDDVRAIIEFLDADQKVLLRSDSTDIMSKAKSRSALKLFETTQTAPVQSASIRFRLLSINKRGRGNGGRFDDLKLVAINPAK